MPKKNAKKYKKPSRSTKKKIKKKYRKYKKLRYSGKKKWYKKFKGKKFQYSFKKSQGLKWSLWLNLAEFLTMGQWDYLEKILMATDKTNNSKYYLGSELEASPTLVDNAIKVISELVTVFSTSCMSTQPLQDNSQFKTKMHWKACNPSLTRRTCGPLFDMLMNQYTDFKFCGVQVKYRPTVKPVSSIVPKSQIGGVYNNQTGNILLQQNPFPVGDFRETSEWEQTDIPVIQSSDTTTSLSMNFVAPPVFRLWINFNKQGYEEVAWCPSKVATSNSKYTSTTLLTGSRFKMARVMDNSNNLMNNGKIKSYNLNKPFKFYVRPKEVTVSYEAPSNETVAANYELETEEGVTNVVSYLNKMADQNQLVTPMKGAQWHQINRLYPINISPILAPPDPVTGENTADAYSRWITASQHDELFYDPILYGWFLTCDNLAPQQVLQPFARMTTGQNNYTSKYYFSNYTLAPNQYLSNIGKFKVTFYIKFKGRRQYQIIPSINKITGNAEMIDEHP